ncbi:GL13416 [Drosophila persimilis]|uniref:GL13416 n=2 Tax=Drosophila persimilis TaxID=7234 RepID=B4H3B1_DROPE|nr:pleckstrin homology domain-containing family A member 8 isoform X1 [Drosophila persimilis]XP_026846633.1 pleckstrin homology domain-containing family A member 8 isoform X1 [Drosophila persimilis]XP_026846635.1 pleckstrin homology domain-containing family A member 8 isoform X1 [Drosophila persimilis]EDW30804.1 GL13416 [Drosophila persimilis]
MSASAARIQFKALKGFPGNAADKIETRAFLDAALEIVTVIETFGKLFTPVINDMNGNIDKLSRVYGENVLKHHYLEDMIVLNIKGENVAPNALLWLKRGLQLICIFFENIYNDDQKQEALKHHLQNAYERTLKQYHGFIVQSTIKIIYAWVPTRKQLLGQGEDQEENLAVMSDYLPTMRAQLNKIDALLKAHNLDEVPH